MTESVVTAEFLEKRTPETFAGVVDEYSDMLRKLIFRVVLNEHDADDVVQETLIEAYRKVDSFKGKAKFSTWLCRIAFNKAYSVLRNRKKTSDFELLDNHMSMASPKNNPSSEMRTSEAHRDIGNAIQKLPDSLRTAITLIVIEERDIDEVAYIMACPKATIYWRVHKARKLLKKELAHLI